MNVNSSLQSSFYSQLFQNIQGTQSAFTPISASMTADMDGDNESTENSSSQQRERASAGLNFKSSFSALKQNGSVGMSTDQLLNALTKQSSSLSTNNSAQSNYLQNILRDNTLSSYNRVNSSTQNRVLSA